MIWSDVTRAALTLILAVIAYTGHLSFLVLALFALLLTLVATLFGPAAMALLPSVVGSEQFGAAQGFMQGSFAGAGFLGSSLGGFLMGVFGPALLILLGAVTFVVSFTSIGMLRLDRLGKAPAAAQRREMGALRQLGADVAEGLRFIRRSPYLGDSSSC